MLVDKGFVGPDKYESIILVGTKADMTEEDDITFFKDSIVPEFFKNNNGKGKFALTRKGKNNDKGDYSELVAALGQLPDFQVAHPKLRSAKRRRPLRDAVAA